MGNKKRKHHRKAKIRSQLPPTSETTGSITNNANTASKFRDLASSRYDGATTAPNGNGKSKEKAESFATESDVIDDGDNNSESDDGEEWSQAWVEKNENRVIEAMGQALGQAMLQYAKDQKQTALLASSSSSLLSLPSRYTAGSVTSLDDSDDDNNGTTITTTAKRR